MQATRTAGDGMESETIIPESVQNANAPFSDPTRTTRARLIQVYPTNISKSEKSKSHIYSKSPKFVPYEPYPAAVKPIVPNKHVKSSKKISKNNMDINMLIDQMSQMDTHISEYKPRNKLISVNEKCTVDSDQCAVNAEMKLQIDQLVRDNDNLKEQLKQQVQVNKELKTMLVASMGEDLETQVQSLNEDKKHLADALLNSAKHLSTHQEQTEWLAGQCEVWRSKFLASSLMVEELANWKRLLNQRTEELQQAMKQMLDERCRAQDMMICTYKNLSTLHEKWLENVAISEYMGNKQMFNRPIGNLNLTNTALNTTNILDLSSVNLKLSENISSGEEKQDISHLLTLPIYTEAEKNAENLMNLPIKVSKLNEEPMNALVSHAYSSSGVVARPVASCQHCNGRVQLL